MKVHLLALPGHMIISAGAYVKVSGGIFAKDCMCENFPLYGICVVLNQALSLVRNGQCTIHSVAVSLRRSILSRSLILSSVDSQ